MRRSAFTTAAAAVRKEGLRAQPLRTISSEAASRILSPPSLAPLSLLSPFGARIKRQQEETTENQWYAGEVFDKLAHVIRLESVDRVVDLGSRSGLFSKKFVKHCPSLGSRLFCTEFLAQLGRNHGVAPNCESPEERGMSPVIPMATGTVDAVVASQASHWFGTDGTLDEVWRVLRPGGTLALVWTSLDTEVDWVRRLDKIWAPRRSERLPGAPAHDLKEFLRHPGMSVPECWTATTVNHVGHETLRRYVASGRQKRAVDALLASQRDLVGSRAALALPHRVVVYWCRRQEFGG